MIVFSDTDIIIKLASLDLLTEALGVLDTDSANTYVLSLEEAKFKDPSIIADYGKAASDRAVAFAKKAQKITKVDRRDFLALSKIIDPGEATLFAATATLQFDTVITGDRKALTKLNASSTCPAILKRIEGKVVCLEQILLDIISDYGFERVRTNMLKSSLPDFALVRIFNKGGEASSDDVCHQLRERVDSIRTDTGKLLSEFFGS